MNEHLAAALVGLVGCGIGGALTPYLIRVLPGAAAGPGARGGRRADRGPEGTPRGAAEGAVRRPRPPARGSDCSPRRISAVAGAGIGAALGWEWLLLPAAAAGADRHPAGHRRPPHPAAARRSWCCPRRSRRWSTAASAGRRPATPTSWSAASICLLVVRTVFWLLWFIRQAGMGFGDVRLSALLGCALGYVGGGPLLDRPLLGVPALRRPGPGDRDRQARPVRPQARLPVRAVPAGGRLAGDRGRVSRWSRRSGAEAPRARVRRRFGADRKALDEGRGWSVAAASRLAGRRIGPSVRCCGRVATRRLRATTTTVHDARPTTRSSAADRNPTLRSPSLPFGRNHRLPAPALTSPRVSLEHGARSPAARDGRM